MNWGSVAIDEINNLMVVNSMHNPSVVRLFPRDEMTGSEQFGIGGSQLGTPYAAYSFFFLSPIFTPCLRPPWGEMAVVDLANQEVLWRRGLGKARDQGPLGIPRWLPVVVLFLSEELWIARCALLAYSMVKKSGLTT